jgi:hypothetical protein
MSKPILFTLTNSIIAIHFSLISWWPVSRDDSYSEAGQLGLSWVVIQCFRQTYYHHFQGWRWMQYWHCLQAHTTLLPRRFDINNNECIYKITHSVRIHLSTLINMGTRLPLCICRLPTADFLLSGGQSMTWLLGNKLITVTTSGCSMKALKNGLCDKCWMLCRADKGENI